MSRSRRRRSVSPPAVAEPLLAEYRLVEVLAGVAVVDRFPPPHPLLPLGPQRRGDVLPVGDRVRPILKAPKSANSYRTVALSSLVVDSLAAHVEAFGTGEDGLMFHVAERPVVRAMASKYIRQAAARAGLEGHGWHDLRHHHASVLLSAGVSPALVAERLGHDVKTLTGTYAHVIRNDDERVRAIVDQSLGVSAEDWLRTKAVS